MLKLKKEIIENIAKLHENFTNKYNADNKNNISTVVTDQLENMQNYVLDPLRIELSSIINSLTQIEKDELIAVMLFGREFELNTFEDFDIIRNKIKHEGDYDTDYILSKAPLAIYLRNGTAKLVKMKKL